MNVFYNLSFFLNVIVYNWKIWYYVVERVELCSNILQKGESNMNRFVSRVMWIFVVLGVIFLFEGASSAINSKKTPVDFNSLKESDFQLNMIVEGYVEYNLGYFEEEYRTTYGIKTGESIYNYLIPISETRYMGLKNQTEDQRIMLDQQTNDTIDMLSGQSVTPTPFYFKGRIRMLTAQESGFMKDYFLSMGYSEAEAQKYMCQYYIECVDFSGGMAKVGIGVLLLVVGLGGLILPIMQEARENKRKQTMLNNLSPGPATENRYDNGMLKDPFAGDDSDSISMTSDEDKWNPTPTYSNTMSDSEDKSSTNNGESSTGLRLKM